MKYVDFAVQTIWYEGPHIDIRNDVNGVQAKTRTGVCVCLCITRKSRMRPLVIAGCITKPFQFGCV